MGQDVHTSDLKLSLGLGGALLTRGLPHRAPGLSSGENRGTGSPGPRPMARPGPLRPGSGLLWDCFRIPLDMWDVLADCLGKSYNQIKELSLEILKSN